MFLATNNTDITDLHRSNMTNLLHKSITDIILKVYYDVYNELGSGFLEKVYQNAMYFELLAKGHKVEAQKPIKVYLKKTTYWRILCRFIGR